MINISVEDKLELVKKGYDLDTLIHDESWEVRKTVAEQSYGLDILIHDSDSYVRQIAIMNK